MFTRSARRVKTTPERENNIISCARTDDIPDAEALIGSEDVRGSIRAQVFSFSRLAWKVLQEVGGASRLHIDEAGVHMLLRKIVESRKDGLSVFQKRGAKRFL